MACIGVGNMGFGHLRQFLSSPEVRIAAICDVRESRRQSAKKVVDAQYGDSGCATYNDFREMMARKDIDAILIATPEHWHVLIGLEAARMGKHMYFEKPMGRTVAEMKAMREAVHRHGVVFQFGTQQRSSRDFRFACELARNGRLGNLHTIVVSSATNDPHPNQPVHPVPKGLDYDMWLGPAPWAPYTTVRCERGWKFIYDYSLGCVSGAWGIHDVDYAQWVNDADGTCPVEVEGTGALPRDGLYTTFITWEVEHRYANGVRLIHMDSRTAAKRIPQFKQGWRGVLLVGDDGWVVVSRQGMEAHPKSLLKATFSPNEIRLPVSNDHRRNFLDAVRFGRETISPIDAAVNSDITCHQADIAMRLKRKLRWDTRAERFADDEQANRMLSRSMRSPWRL